MFVEMVFAGFYFVHTVHNGEWFQWSTLVVIHKPRTSKTLVWASKIWEPLATGPPTIEFNLLKISTHNYTMSGCDFNPNLANP